MREMIGVVKYTCDFCGGTITKPSSTISRLPAGWENVIITNDVMPTDRRNFDRCPQCREQNANK